MDSANDREMTCAEVVELITDYLDGVMSADNHARFDEHLETCPFCQIYLDQMRETIKTLGCLPEESISPEVLDTLLEHFRRQP